MTEGATLGLVLWEVSRPGGMGGPGDTPGRSVLSEGHCLGWPVWGWETCVVCAWSDVGT